MPLYEIYEKANGSEDPQVRRPAWHRIITLLVTGGFIFIALDHVNWSSCIHHGFFDKRSRATAFFLCKKREPS